MVGHASVSHSKREKNFRPSLLHSSMAGKYGEIRPNKNDVVRRKWPPLASIFHTALEAAYWRSSRMGGYSEKGDNVIPIWPGHPVERVTPKHHTKCNISQLQISTLKADYRILWYLSIKYILLDIFTCSGNILGCDNMDIYIYIARAERIFGNTGK
jgi:hypothetical protein